MADIFKSSGTVDIQKEIQSIRKKLLDLTMRNKLLNFHPSKTKTIRVIDEIPAEIYNILVLQEKSMQFRATTGRINNGHSKDEDTQSPLWKSQKESSDPNQEEASTLWKLPSKEVEPLEKHTDSYLQTNLESETLQKRLFYIYQDSKSVLEELGYSTLYLALTFLEWTESDDSQETRIAPLILLPVELERTGVRSAFKVKWNGEDVSTNISLKETLSQQNITLPDFELPENKDGINEYLQKIVRAIKAKAKWHVLNDIHLGFFSFTKFIMYKDLDPKVWEKGKSIVEHPLIKAVFGSSDNCSTEVGFQENDVDEMLKSHDVYHVLDADSSQIAVIEDVKAGRNLAVEGPPGTGKSQTIVNIIAELLASNKSVLFVSEKMAALEVVKSRLDQVGLGNFCLELHSRKANKKEVLNNLELSLSMVSPKFANVDGRYGEIENIKGDLNGYVKALREPFGKIRLSPYALFCQKAKARQYFDIHEKQVPNIKFEDVESWDSERIEVARKQLCEMQALLPSVIPFSHNPWPGCNPGLILPSHVAAINNLLSDCLVGLVKLQERIDSAVDICAATRPNTLKEVTQSINAAKVIALSKPVDPDVLMNPEWNQPSEQAKLLIDRLGQFRDIFGLSSSKFTESALTNDVDSTAEEFNIIANQLFKFINIKYYRLRKQVRTLYKNKGIKKSDNEISSDLDELKKCQKLRKELRTSKQNGIALFGSFWNGDESDLEALKSFSNWIVTFRKQLLDKALTEQTVQIVSKGISRERVEKAARDLADSKTYFESKFIALMKAIGADYKAIFGNELNDISISDFSNRLNSWKTGINQLQRWSQYMAIRRDCLEAVGSGFFDLIETDRIDPDALLPCFESNIADNLLNVIFVEHPELANFAGSVHENKIDRFAELDRKLIEQNRRRLIHELYKDLPNLNQGASPGSEAGILLGEFNRKRGHMPIRKLMSGTGNLIQNIKPCFMMSPLSIAQFLDPKITKFDAIIFDEASQVRPEDALGSLLRGNQVVVIGDTRQLPPTSFFDHILEDDTEDQEESSASYKDTESILHLCRRCFPIKTLRWHYRSKHESLVAVSNQEFYFNQLLLYPSPIQNSKELGLQFVHLPDTIYDRGASQSNRMEARAIVEHAFEHYRQFPTKSLGIGAFSKRQQETILEEIDLRLRQYPDMEEYFKSTGAEHFFVKNLETIQGDERDVIFISIGYGFDKFRKLTLNFGPLNNDGGERRLNVLITRSREKCVVFSNFKAADLQLEATASHGLRALKLFLDFAETRYLNMKTTDQDTDSPFEDSVYEVLKSHGCEVRKQVGCAGFRVDLAVVDPTSPGNFLLGIECDGAKYHTSPVARDRDRLRQQILEKLGWEIYRIWSTDWYRNHEECEQRLLNTVEERKQRKAPPDFSGNSNPEPEVESSPDDPDGQENSTAGQLVLKGSLKTINDEVKIYRTCNSLGFHPTQEIPEFPPAKLADIVVHVVETESPVHVDEVIRRIRTLWQLNRTGNRIQEAINEAISIAMRDRLIKKRAEFLWSVDTPDIRVRRRDGDPPAKIELICDEEIVAAIELVLRYQFATLPDDLVVQASRLLGFRATSEKTIERIAPLIGKLIRQKKLQKKPNGMVDLPER